MRGLPESDLSEILIPEQLTHHLSVLRKNIGNPRRLPNFLKKNKLAIKNLIVSYINSISDTDFETKQQFIAKLRNIYSAIEENRPDKAIEELDYIVGLQKLIEFIKEI